MQTYLIRGKKVEFDDSKRYLDFQVKTDTQERFLTVVDWPTVLQRMQRGDWSLDDPDFVDFLRFMERWVDDGPRKRRYREAVRAGFFCLTREYFFEDHPEGEQIINDLENTGLFARYLLVTLGLGAKDYWASHQPLPF
jgi:hypothetical protein